MVLLQVFSKIDKIMPKKDIEYTLKLRSEKIARWIEKEWDLPEWVKIIPDETLSVFGKYFIDKLSSKFEEGKDYTVNEFYRR